jgi:hypothetical protein
MLTKTSSYGLVVLIGFVTVLVFVVWRARASAVAIPGSLALGFISFSFGWAYLSMWRTVRGCRKLGYDRSNFTKLLSGPRPDDPDELLIWNWTFQLCYAVFAVLLCALALVYAA